jgi:hypothetical protein
MKTRLELVATYKPLAKGDEPYKWVNETSIAPLGHLCVRPAGGCWTTLVQQLFDGQKGRFLCRIFSCRTAPDVDSLEH